ncbi:DUF1638 domain-containing protein [Geomesophilobacter sediminis]|uniref:DUF1638 domain-containing protein n=1 Tax=Geomesophilobacter sediminis TaxID=2798584 RepID=A0A8J7JL53_9BACT|nr:DUF1638 domain-containing protein [Geomesophilobacter sediminis]MBJ6724505.1 DUF1638 domain-containing protein [Geomesophilobacter sediminis]
MTSPVDQNGSGKGSRLILVACGILQREITVLIEQNRWPVDPLFLDAELHSDLPKLGASLQAILKAYPDREKIVFYGACHPRMDLMLAEAGALRTAGQNCAAILLGKERFQQELAEGACFLLEEWARRWEPIVFATLGTTKLPVIRQVFRESGRHYLLALSTPCSGDYHHDAAEAALLVGLPLRWLDVGLEHLEAALAEVVESKLARVTETARRS